MVVFVVACFGTAFIVSILSTRLMLSVAPAIGLVDHPAERKVHTVPTPLGGGLAVWAAVVAPLGLAHLTAWLVVRGALPSDWLPATLVPHLDGFLYRAPLLWGILAAGTLLTVMGLIDDIRNLPWWPRLVVQLMVALALVLGADVRATVFVPWTWVGQVVSVVWILVLINAFNFLDNMDALSGGIGAIVSIVFATIMLTCSTQPHWFVAGMLLMLAGALAGFLWFNWPPARIFMGDAGSYFVGLMIATSTLLGTFYEFESTGGRNQHVILAPLCVLAVPLYDFVSVILIRLSEGRSPFHPDKSHFSHRLVEMGFSARDAVVTIHLATVTTGIAGLLLYRVSDWVSGGLVFLLVLFVLWIVAILETVGRRAD